MGQPAVNPQAQAELASMQRSAAADKRDAITDSVSRETRDLLLRFGAASSFTGSGATQGPGPMSGFMRLLGGKR